MGLTLADFAGLLREAPWNRALTDDDFPADAPFAAYFTRNPWNPLVQDLFLMRVLIATHPSYMPFLLSQFPSLRASHTSRVAFEMSRDDFARMRLLFGGTGWN